jgi:acetyl esterase/lipase
MVVHGDNDTYTPVDGARLLVDGVRAASPNPVMYLELRCAQHSFDLFHSVRFETVVDAIEAYTGGGSGPETASGPNADPH